VTLVVIKKFSQALPRPRNPFNSTPTLTTPPI
jgi:hypothetical protein